MTSTQTGILVELYLHSDLSLFISLPSLPSIPDLFFPLIIILFLLCFSSSSSDNETIRKFYSEKGAENCHMELYMLCQEGLQLVKKMELDFNECQSPCVCVFYGVCECVCVCVYFTVSSLFIPSLPPNTFSSFPPLSPCLPPLAAMICNPPKSYIVLALQQLELVFFIENKPVVALLVLLLLNLLPYTILIPVIVSTAAHTCTYGFTHTRTHAHTRAHTHTHTHTHTLNQ